MEYKAQELFGSFGLPANRGILVHSVEELSKKMDSLTFPLVLKAQVETGGRGKAGGVRIVKSQKTLLEEAEAILNLTINGFEVKKLYVVEALNFQREMYLSIIFDRAEKVPLLIFCGNGGVDINEIAEKHPEDIIRYPLMPGMGIRGYMTDYILDKSGMNRDLKEPLQGILEKLYELFLEKNALLVEVNPLVLTEKGELVLLDGKITVDDNALYKHEDLRVYRDEMEENALILDARTNRFLYIPIEDSGTIGVISNGSGMIMSSIDLISQKNLSVKCALDLGGGATAERIKEAVRIVLSSPDVKLLFINIFGGITRCDEIARGVKLAYEESDYSIPLVLRLEGTNKEEGLEIIESLPVSFQLSDDIVDGVEKIVKLSAVGAQL